MSSAGGYDAICVVVLHERVLQAVEDLWVQWPSTHPDSTYVSHANVILYTLRPMLMSVSLV